MISISRIFPLLLALAVMLMPACNASKSAKGGAIGGATGGVIGGAIGKKSGDGTKGAVIGAVVGGAAGAIIGKYMDKQAEEIEENIPNATVERIETTNEYGEKVTEGINVTFDSGILFEFGKYSLTEASRVELRRMADVFVKYPDTDIEIDGHTDSVGSDATNQRLSEQRAASVADYLASLNIARSRMVTHGYGETMPVASNDTDQGRQANRRVQVSISANPELQQKANDGTLTVPE